MILEADVWEASEKRYPVPMQRAHHAPPDISEVDKAQELQTAFEEGAQWFREQAVKALEEVVQREGLNEFARGVLLAAVAKDPFGG